MTFATGDFTTPFPEVKTKDEVADMTNTAVEMGTALQTIIRDCGSEEFSAQAETLDELIQKFQL